MLNILEKFSYLNISSGSVLVGLIGESLIDSLGGFGLLDASNYYNKAVYTIINHKYICWILFMSLDADFHKLTEYGGPTLECLFDKLNIMT